MPLPTVSTPSRVASAIQPVSGRTWRNKFRNGLLMYAPSISVDKLAVGIRLLHEHVVGSLCYNRTLVHDDNRIGVTDRAETVSDDEYSAISFQVRDGFQHCGLVLCIEVGSRLVQNQQGRV